MRSILSGSSGFIGTALAARLGTLGHQIIKLPRELLLNIFNLEVFLKEKKPDYIFHLAAYGNLVEQQEESKIWDVNLGGLCNLLDSATAINYKAFINFSTSSVLLKEQTFYSVSKACGEKIAEIYQSQHKKPIVTVRLSSVTGVGEQETHLIPTLIRSCLEHKIIPFVPEPTHDFIDIDDVISAVLLLAGRAQVFSKNQIFNISANKSYTNEQVKELVEKVTSRKVLVHLVPSLRIYDNPNWRVDNSELLKLDWKPTKTLEESIKEMVHEKHRFKASNFRN